ncbi:hypothetical protein [Anabaena sp. CCY 9402-a]|uniref:hypothetical protein n=1 Tax=Anabaena sp. CCY 9402-a TaxID=3103867 RepID=UPI0039C5FBDD
MISLLKRHRRSLACFLSGLVVAIIFSFTTPDQKPATASVQIPTQVAAQPMLLGHPDFYYSHEESNFYQYQ